MTERDLSSALRAAFHRAPDLAASPDFENRLRDSLRATAIVSAPAERRSVHWLWTVAASVALAAAVVAAVVWMRPPSPMDVLAQDAISDHRKCALKMRLIRRPVPLEEASERFDASYRLLADAPGNVLQQVVGTIDVIDRHSCVIGSRRFGHVVMRYQGHIVSLLMTGVGAEPLSATVDTTPRLIGEPAYGLSVVSVTGVRHAFLIVSDLDTATLTRLSAAIAAPLAVRAEARR
jgi:hypothetical protein